MGRNSDRVELFQEALNKATKNTSVEEMVEDLDYLNMALNIALYETAFEKPLSVINIYGYPCIKTDKSLFLVKPVINNVCFNTLEPTGRLVKIDDEELLDRLSFEAEITNLLSRIVIIKIWNNIGLISKADDSFYKARAIPFRNKLHYYKVEILEVAKQ